MEDFNLKEIIQSLSGYINTPIGRRKYPIDVVECVKILEEMIKPDTLMIDTKIVAQAYIAFTRFIYNKIFEIDHLVVFLKGIEADLIKEEIEKTNDLTEKGLWFRFSKDDTAVTTIQDLENTFKNDNKNNKNFYIALIGEALNHQTLEIHFS